MPHLARTIIPKIRASFAERGVAATLWRGLQLPQYLVREYRRASQLPPGGPRSEFDLAHGVDTDGDRGGWTFLSDLRIPSPNWIHGVNYCGIDPTRFLNALLSVDIKHDDFVFIDFGSGKGRALLMASEFPFQRIIGIEFSPELHAIALRNLREYQRGPNGCDTVDVLCMDFVDFVLPPVPAVLYFYEPCDDVVFAQVLTNIQRSLRDHPRPLHLLYLAPGSKEAVLDATDFLIKQGHNTEFQFCWYSARR